MQPQPGSAADPPPIAAAKVRTSSPQMAPTTKQTPLSSTRRKMDSGLKKIDVAAALERLKERREKKRREKSSQTPQKQNPEQRASRERDASDESTTQKKQRITQAADPEEGAPLSLLASPNATASLGFIRQLPDMKDREVLGSYSNKQVLENFAKSFGQSLALAGEVANRFVAVEETASGSERAIADLKARLDAASRNYKALEEAKADAVRRVCERNVQIAAMQRVIDELKGKLADFDAHYVHRESFLSSKEFLKTKELNKACGVMALIYFDHGFNGCLAQIRDGGFSAEQYPFDFLDSDKAFDKLPEDDEEEKEILMRMMMKE